LNTNPPVTSLQDLLDSTPDLVDYLYQNTLGTARYGTGIPIPAEFSNWREEQLAWRESAILFDQSHHMHELFLRGPDSVKLLNGIGVNSLANLGPGVAKQFIGCNSQGQVIGDCILYAHPDGTYELVSGMPLLNWVEYQAITGSWDVEIQRDNNTPNNKSGSRVRLRFQLDGPKATEILENAADEPLPDAGPFRVFSTRVKGIDVQVLRHGMAGRHRAYEISGPFKHYAAVRSTLIDAGQAHGLRLGGLKAYFSTNLESGWIAGPLPAVYTAEDMRGFREWLSADGHEASYQLGGSYRSANIEDYYATPYDLGYDRIVKFDHDFTGRAALEELAKNPPRRRVTLIWNREDVLTVIGSLFDRDVPYKYMDFPIADYAISQRDEIRVGSRLVGLSTFCGYSANERKFLSLAIIDAEYASPGTQVTVLWGEPDGGSRKPAVERHRQFELHATVAPAPFAYSPQSTGAANRA
jgi:vanillate/3-O-methylgallate O-demethylase